LKDAAGTPRRCPVSDDAEVRSKVRALCEEPRHLLFGYRRIGALLLRRWHMRLNHKTVLRVMQKEGLTRPRVWHRVKRPKRLERMKPVRPHEAWQIDMTSFQLSDMRTLYLITVIDCYTRQIVGWTLHRRCRTSEWISAVRMGLESRGLKTKEDCRGMTLRSDNGSQPCSKKFVDYLSKAGVAGQYTGYNAPDDNAYVERFIRTIKEEELWLNLYDTFAEAHRAVDEYISYYNQERIHSALKYATPNEMAAAHVALAVA
jgi:putative transposase